MKRRQKGTGTIVKVGNIYYGRIVLQGKVKKVRLCGNLREAETQWKEWVRQNVSKFKTEATRHPIGDLWAMVEESWRLEGRSPKSIREDKFRFDSFIEFLTRGGIKFLEDVTQLDIINFFDESCGSLTYGSSRKYRAVIRSLYHIAAPNAICPVDKLGLKKTTNVAREPFTDEELKTILDNAETMGHSWKVLIEVGLYTGLRLKDCVFLSTDKVQGGVIMTEPYKTKQKGIVVRIPLHPILATELKSLGIENGQYFPEQIELYNKSSQIEYRLRKIFSKIGTICKKAEGHSVKVSTKGFHALRATFITRLAERGVSLAIMESLAGHINPQQTTHYVHPDEAVKVAAVSVLPNFDDNDKENKVFIHPDVQKVIDLCKAQIKETIEKTMGKKVEVRIETQEILGGKDAFFNL